MNGHAASPAPQPESLDIIVIGAGISGINTGYRIQTDLPSSTYAILESRHELGGTWSLFRYPGVRSDSDLHTFGFSFNPWTKPNPIATGESIVEYMHETSEKFAIDEHIRYGHRVLSADWKSEEQKWRLEVETSREGVSSVNTKIFWAKFLIMGTGYYDYDKPLQAEIPGLDNFQGKKVHPQFWPEDLDFKGKKMVVIGSGATTITILPAVVDRGVGSVTQLQRSPSYVMNMPQRKSGDPLPLTDRLFPGWLALYIKRIQFILIPYMFYLFCRAFPTTASNLLRKEAKRQLPPDFPMDPHFKPVYKPWDQRLCLCPDSDFFRCFETGRASIVTGTIKQVVADGIELDSGEKLPADIIITATGLNLRICGGVELSVDGKVVPLPDQYIWRATMLTNLPNLGLIIGYVNASWTLGADAASRLLTRVYGFMQDNGYTSATPQISPEEKVDPQSPLALQSTYVKSGMSKLPHAGRSGAWKPRDNYIWDRFVVGRADLREGMRFEKVAT